MDAKAEFSQSFTRRTSSTSEQGPRSRTFTSESKESLASTSLETYSNSNLLVVERSPSSSPQTGSGSFSSLLLERAQACGHRHRKETPSSISLTQNVLERYYGPSIVSWREREREESSSSTDTMESDASFVSARKGEEVADGAAMLESLMVQLEASWDSEEELEGGNRVGGKENVVRDEEEAEETEEELMFAVQEAKGWRWPVPPSGKGGKAFRRVSA